MSNSLNEKIQNVLFLGIPGLHLLQQSNKTPTKIFWTEVKNVITNFRMLALSELEHDCSNFSREKLEILNVLEERTDTILLSVRDKDQN